MPFRTHEQNDNPQMKNKLPIGYYLKKADNLLTAGINKIHAENGITRTQWQVLNSIIQKDEADRQQVIELLNDFAAKDTINEVIDILINRGLVNENSFLYLTDRGKELFEKCFQEQKIFRQKAMGNISEQEYMQLITTLEKIIDNLR